jgi:DNA-binding NtrC family response regulator
VQAKFLRVLQEREFQRLGGTRVMRADVRIVAATNRDLLRAMEKGAFREDLYYRLNVFAITLPPLRERRDDVLPLCDAFLAEYGKSLGRPPAGISRDARERLLSYQWPGNVRELRNVLERAAILCDGGLITSDHLALNLRPPAPWSSSGSERDGDSRDRRPRLHDEEPPRTRDRGRSEAAEDEEGEVAAGDSSDDEVETPGHLQAVERGLIEKALKTARFNKSKAAKQLGLSRAQLYVRLKKYGLE